MEMDKPFHSTVAIRFPSPKHAYIVKSALEVDEELQPTKVTRQFEVVSEELRV